METYLALLRGINVSGHNMIRMDALKLAMGELDFSGIRTYIQSGNIIFNSRQKDPAVLTEEIAGKILERFGVVVPVVIRTLEEMQTISKNNPFPVEKYGGTDRMHVTFLSGFPDDIHADRTREYNFLPDEFLIKGKEVYLYCPDGYGRTKLTNQFFESKLKVVATTRNWKTVETLAIPTPG